MVAGMTCAPALLLTLSLSGTALRADETAPSVQAEELVRVPPSSPAEALGKFRIRPGFRVELASCEPALVDPVAVAFDENSVLYAVEMRDYSERRADKLSRVRRLEDRDGDGVFEHSTVYFEGIAWATAVACWDGGVFVAASPDIWFVRDTDGDGVADERRVVFTGFGAGREKLNVQALVNSLTWGPDNRIHGATAGNGGLIHRIRDGQPAGDPVNVTGADFSFDPVTLDFRAESGTAQFGLTFDEHGQKFVCANSHHLQWVSHTKRDAALTSDYPLPPALIDIPVDGPAAEVFRISPEEPWRVVRTRWRASGLVPGIVEGGGRSSGYFTSASGVHIASGLTCRGCAFTGDVGSNLVHRKVITWTQQGPTARRAADEQRSEFVASSDNWFRPVACTTGPDGGLYIVDIYREFIEHPDSLPPAIKQHMDLNSGNDRGRLWRVVPDGFQRQLWPRLGQLDTAALQSQPPVTGWHTATARRLLHARGVTTMPPAPVIADPEEKAAREALDALFVAARAGGGNAAELTRFFAADGPDSQAGWQPGTGAALARWALRKKENAPALLAILTKERGSLQSLQIALFLKVPPGDALLDEARRWLAAHPGDEARQLTAVAGLAAVNAPALEAAALTPQHRPSVRSAALRARPQFAGRLLEQWATQPGAVRLTILELLSASAAGADQLLTALEAGKLSATEIPAQTAQQLRRMGTAAQQARAARLLPPPPANRQAVVAARQGALQREGAAAAGRELFRQFCAACHRDGSEGAAVGPDRATFRNLGKPTLLLHLIDPNREVAPRYFTTLVRTGDDETLAGVITDESGTTLRLAMPGGVNRELDRTKVVSVERQSRSLMPEGLESAWTDQQIADLLAFLVE